MTHSLISCSPDVMGGTRCLPGHVCPSKLCWTILKLAKRFDNFLEGFPTVSRDQVVAFLEEAKDRMVAAVL